ncbi:hypothetical protein PUMCH_004090 [Australozyma saopauloensis]|uniref:non-specific serine/threonine protein kinase n=1 Tax=Australozyma saopauloensis TaxID=291208 RepID=A0AAX4HGH0_9ASCO|nr:hypothetical protein PUMCH_004090 [[Candida] saopauloensis]
MSRRPSEHRASLNDLSDQIHAVYRHLLEEGGAASSSGSLDSTQNELAVRTPRLDNAFILTHLSPFHVDENSSVPRSAPETPHAASMLESPVSHLHLKAVTDSSVDVIRDSATPEPGLYSPYDDKRKLNQTYSIPDSIDRSGTPGHASTAIDEEEDWSERGAAVAVAPGPNGPTSIRRTVKDFEFGKDLGEGSYSTVVLATDKITKTNYAVKVLDKKHIIKEKKVKYVNIEKHALNRLSGLNGIISMFFTFQDKDSLYYVLEFASNGELLGFIKTYGSLNEDCTRHFGAQILDAIKNMHDNGIIHRDIKPENILIDDKFRIRITDFGTAKLLERKKNGESGVEEEYPLDVRAKSFVGTAEYVSPELLESKYCGKPGDIWAFGCLLYQMIAGKPPFKATNEYLTFQKITKLQYAFSAGFPLILRDLIKQILVLRPSRRASIEQIQQHLFFEKCNFKDPDSIWNAKLPELSPYKVTAQSMTKMPTKSAQPVREQRAPIKKKPQLQPQPKNTPAEASKLKKASTSEDKGLRNITPASVAAYVLNKEDDHSSPEVSTPKTTSHTSTPQKSQAPPDYIPGTNILRPQVNSMANFSRLSTSSSNKSDPELKRSIRSKTKELAPPTAVEAAWQQYLSPDERIIHVGSVTASKKTTEAFERKHKGMIHDTPLGFNNQLKSAQQRGGQRSMLSRYVKDNQLKDKKDLPPPEVESDAITFFYEEVTAEPEPHTEEDEKSTLLNIGHGRFGKSLKKLLANSDKKTDSVETIYENGNVTRQTVSLERPRACTVIITTFGRVLLFLRDDIHSDYKLICEVKLQYPFIQFKEVVTSPSTKFGKQIPASGIFAIESKFITFVFEVEKYEVNQWTESLARSKLCLIEREHEVEAPRVSQPKLALPKIPSTPELMEAPRFGSNSSPNGNEMLLPSRITRSPSQPRTLDPKGSPLNNLLAQRRMRAKETTRRKAPPPPPSKSQHLALTGLRKDPENGEKATVHAAQLAVSNLNLSPTPRNEYRSSSFTKETPRAHKNFVATLAGNVTPMNSKLLARTRGGK